MKFTLLLSVLALVSTGFASTSCTSEWGNDCVSLSEATYLVNTYITLFTQPVTPALRKVAEKLFSAGYSETSDSTNILAGLPLGSITAPTKQAAINAIFGIPRIDDVRTQEIAVFNCDQILWSWTWGSVGGCSKYEIKGNHIFNATSKKLTAARFEYNSAAFGLDLGFQFIFPNGTSYPNCPPPSGSPSADAKSSNNTDLLDVLV